MHILDISGHAYEAVPWQIHRVLLREIHCLAPKTRVRRAIILAASTAQSNEALERPRVTRMFA
jgi:hypothetical protein